MQGTQQDLERVSAEQLAYFRSGATRSYEFRTQQLRRLKSVVKGNEQRILDALRADLGKPEMEAYGSEVGGVYAEINHALRHLQAWMKPKRVGTPLALQPATSYILPEPYGQVLIISPWNYPFDLAIAPLVGAMAAGNCAVLKPSELAPHTSALLAGMLADAFPTHYIATILGGPDTAQALLARKWDTIFFTGSTAIGRIVARAAAEHLTPVTLELGGKSPCIVDRDTNVDLTARRVAWGKFFNAGQTCVAPDYLLVHTAVKDQLLQRLRHHLREFFGEDPARSPDYARIINTHHFDRLIGLLGERPVVVGGAADRESRYIAPTVIEGVELSDPLMQDEIFGPLLPVLTFDSADQALTMIHSLPKPLALYVFSNNAAIQERFVREVPFGGGCVNDTLVHFANPNLPFGGVGESGRGAYHGRYSFETFSHHKAIVKASTALDPKVRYQPYRGKLRLLKLVVK